MQSTRLMHLPFEFFLQLWHLLDESAGVLHGAALLLFKLSSRNENTEMSRAYLDKCQKLMKLPNSNPKPDLCSINGYTKYGRRFHICYN